MIKKILIPYSVLTTAMIIGLCIELDTRTTQLKEEETIRYEYSAIIDSLETELEGSRHWYEMNEMELYEIDTLQSKKYKSVQW